MGYRSRTSHDHEVNEGMSSFQPEARVDQRLTILLAMAMFVLVVDTSLMNVYRLRRSRPRHDRQHVQAAISLGALVSAAFLLIGSRVGDLIGRKRTYALGLLGYAVGVVSMTLTQSVLPIIIFWAILGGLGASLLLPAMQSLIHGNFEGAAQRKVYALVGAAITNMTAVKLALQTYDPERVQGAILDRDEIDRQIELYRTRVTDSRREIIGLQPKRADVILAGACIVRAVMDKLGERELTVSDRGLRHGLLIERFST